MRAWLLRLTAILAVGCATAAAAQTGAGPRIRMAVLGDSLSTGAAAHPALTFDTADLWRVFTGETSVATGLTPPRRLWPSPREFFGNGDWVFRNSLQSVSRQYLDTEEYSWGYALAQRLGIAPAELAIAAENGSRVMHATRHLDRLLDATGGLLPEKTFLFYSGNDLCGQALPAVTSARDFEAALVKALEYALRNGAVPEGARADIYLVGYLSVLQLLHSDDILAKPIKAFGRNVTCRDLRAASYRPKDPAYSPEVPPEAWFFPLFMPPNPVAFCPTLFGREGRDEEIGALANRIREFRQVQRDVAERFSARLARERPDGRLQVRYVEATTELIFQAADIAGDCFHLSASGQQRVADAVANALSRL